MVLLSIKKVALKKGNEFVGPKKQRHAKYLITRQDTPSRPAETAAAFLNRHEKRCKTFKKARGDRYSLKHQYTMHTHGKDKWHMLMHIRTQVNTEQGCTQEVVSEE